MILDLGGDLALLLLEQRAAPNCIDRAVLGRSHQPGTRIVRDTVGWPLLQREQEGVLGQILGLADVLHDASEARDDLRRFDPPDRLDGLMNSILAHSEKLAFSRARKTRQSTFLRVPRLLPPGLFLRDQLRI